MTRIVVLDGHVLNPGDNTWEDVAASGELTVYDRTSADQVVPRAKDAEILLTAKTPLTADALEQMPDLGLIVVLGSDCGHVDMRAAGSLGVIVSNAPGFATRSVAEFVFALVFEHYHHVGQHDEAVKAGEWSSGPDWCFTKSPQLGLAGKTMGIVGYGAIGKLVGETANALGMAVYVYNPRPKQEPRYKPFGFGTLERVFSKSDVVSLHCPLNGDNRGFVNKDLLSLMKPEALLVNTAHGALVDEADLVRALDSGTIGGAALDVAVGEPLPKDSPLLTAKNIILTPHIAWASRQARRALMRITAETVHMYAVRGRRTNVANRRFLENFRA